MIKISAILLTTLILISSIGISLDMHYCQGQLKSIAFLGQAKSCHTAKKMQNCHHKKDTSSKNKLTNKNDNSKDNCCQNEKLVITKSDFNTTNPQFVSFNNHQLTFITSFVISFICNYNQSINQSHYSKYIPPLPHNDVIILFQTFRI